jgi:hypothetical protein
MLAGSETRTLRMAGDTVNWTLVSGPTDIMISVATVRNSQAVDTYIRTDSADPNTQDTIPANFERTFRFSRKASRSGLFYFQFASGTGPLVVQFNT